MTAACSRCHKTPAEAFIGFIVIGAGALSPSHSKRECQPGRARLSGGDRSTGRVNRRTIVSRQTSDTGDHVATVQFRSLALRLVAGRIGVSRRPACTVGLTRSRIRQRAPHRAAGDRLIGVGGLPMIADFLGDQADR